MKKKIKETRQYRAGAGKIIDGLDESLPVVRTGLVESLEPIKSGLLDLSQKLHASGTDKNPGILRRSKGL